MDTRTIQLLKALDAVSLDLLIELLGGPATEARLIDAIDADVSQPTVHRRLEKLAESGLVEQPPGSAHAPNRAWRVAHPTDTERFVAATLKLVDALEDTDRRKRAGSKRRLKRARASRGRMPQVNKRQR